MTTLYTVADGIDISPILFIVKLKGGGIVSYFKKINVFQFSKQENFFKNHHLDVLDSTNFTFLAYQKVCIHEMNSSHNNPDTYHYLYNGILTYENKTIICSFNVGFLEKKEYSYFIKKIEL